MLDDVALQEALVHTQRPAFGIELALLKVVAVAAIQVADRAERLDENLKFSGSLRCRRLPTFGEIWLRIHGKSCAL